MEAFGSISALMEAFCSIAALMEAFGSIAALMEAFCLTYESLINLPRIPAAVPDLIGYLTVAR